MEDGRSISTHKHRNTPEDRQMNKKSARAMLAYPSVQKYCGRSIQYIQAQALMYAEKSDNNTRRAHMRHEHIKKMNKEDQHGAFMRTGTASPRQNSTSHKCMIRRLNAANRQSLECTRAHQHTDQNMLKTANLAVQQPFETHIENLTQKILQYTMLLGKITCPPIRSALLLIAKCKNTFKKY